MVSKIKIFFFFLRSNSRSSPPPVDGPPQTSPRAPESVKVDMSGELQTIISLIWTHVLCSNYLFSHPEDVAGGEGHVGGGAALDCTDIVNYFNIGTSIPG